MFFLKRYGRHAIIGALAGFINGLLGAGGGIIVTYYLSRTLTGEQREQNGVFANAVATMLPVSVFSLALYYFKGLFSFDSGFLSLLPQALIGGVLGAFLLTKIKFKWVKIIFSVLVVVSGFMMIFR